MIRFTNKQQAPGRVNSEALMKYTFQRPDVTKGHKCSELNITQRTSLFILIVMLSVFVSLCIALFVLTFINLKCFPLQTSKIRHFKPDKVFG